MGFWNLTLLCLFFYLGKGINTHPIGECVRNINGSTLFTAYCCQHYFNDSGRCQECPNGFTSIDGISCFPCSDGTYGRKCGEICLCTYDSCHHIDGCMQFEDDKSYHLNETSTYQETTTSLHNQTTTYNVTTTGHYSDAIMTRNLIMYSLTPTILIVFIIGIVYWRRRQNRGGDIQLSDVEEVYHTIAENTLLDNLPTNLRVYKEHSDNSEEKDRKRLSESDGVNAEIESSSEVGEEHILDYLNPYQPVLMTDRQNEYTALSTEIFNNSSAESDSDSYLNPHQTVQKRSEHGEGNNDSRIVITLRRNVAPTTGDENRAYSIYSDKSYQSYQLENRECSSTSDESYQIYCLNN